MSVRQTISRFKRIWHRGRPLLLVGAFIASLTASSVAFAVPSPTTGDITGKVTDQNGVALSGIKVDAFVPNSDMSSSSSVAWTESDGTYDLSNLPSGEYEVMFNNQPRGTDAGLYYLTQLYNNQSSQGTPDLVTVNANAVTPDIDDALAPAGVITGKVADTNGNGLPGIKVSAYVADSNMQTSYTTWTLDDGTYYINAPAGDYTVLCNNMPGEGTPGAYFTHEWYNNVPTGGAVTPDSVSVSTNVTTPGIDATLDPAGAVSGRVVNEDGQGLADIKITGFASLGDVNDPGNLIDTAFVFTDENGNYFMGGLPAGSSYIIDFNGPGDSDPYHLEQFYDNQPSIDTANAVTVVNNTTTPNINAVFQTLGAISGTVKDTTGAPAQVRVSVYATKADYYNKKPAASTQTNSDGTYEIDHLAAGKYYLYFESLPGYFYIPEFYNNKQTISTASAITVVKGVTTPGFNATMSLLSPTTGSLTVHTTKLVPACMGPDGDSLPGICEALFAGESTSASASVNMLSTRWGTFGNVNFTYNTSAHSFRLVSKSLSQFYRYGNNHATAGLQGMATLTVDGVTTTNMFRIIATDGKLCTKHSDQFGIFIWAPGADPSSTTPMYYMDKPLLNGNVTVRP